MMIFIRIHIILNSLIDPSQLNVADFFHVFSPEILTKMVKNALSHSVEETEKKYLDLPLYPDLHLRFIGSTLG